MCSKGSYATCHVATTESCGNSPPIFSCPRSLLQSVLPHGAMGGVAQAAGRPYKSVAKMFEGLLPMSIEVFAAGLAACPEHERVKIARSLLRCTDLLVTTKLSTDASTDERQAVVDSCIARLHTLRGSL